MGAEALDLFLRSLDHRLEVGDELLVHRVVRGAEGVESGCAGSVENPKHGQVPVRGSRHDLRVPMKRLVANFQRRFVLGSFGA